MFATECARWPPARICADADRDCGDGLLGIGANVALIGVLPAWFLYPTRPIGRVADRRQP
jgi:hypothetical protein